MLRTVKIHEIRDTDQLNEMISQTHKFLLYERIVNEGEITYFVAEIQHHQSNQGA